MISFLMCQCNSPPLSTAEAIVTATITFVIILGGVGIMYALMYRG